MKPPGEILDQVAEEVRVCQKCDLWKGRKNAVAGEGRPDSKVVFIGEGPGRKEDESGMPFVGTAGERLAKLIGEAGLTRDRVFITNIVKCRPPSNRRPTKLEAGICHQYLRRQLEALDPSLIVLLGDTALRQFFPQKSLASSHGRTLMREGNVFFSTYHPASTIYNPSLSGAIYEDFRCLKELVRARR